MTAQISIVDLELWTHIGVPEAERVAEQRILVTVIFEVEYGKVEETDDITNTVDYEVVQRRIRDLAKREYKTLERFGGEIANMVLKDSRVSKVTVTLRKFILPGTKEVSLTIIRP